MTLSPFKIKLIFVPCRGSHDLSCPRASDLGIAHTRRVSLVASATAPMKLKNKNERGEGGGGGRAVVQVDRDKQRQRRTDRTEHNTGQTWFFLKF